MARQYRLGPIRKAINVLTSRMARGGRGPKALYVLTVRGRTTGEPRSTPVDVMELDGKRYLVAPYGAVSWVKNARAAGEVELTRKTTERFALRELGPEASVPVLRKYLTEIKVVRPYFDVKPDASDEDFARIAPDKPVFELMPNG
ncbi:MAG: nitroreductase/quinone reductase family protein [Actinomycetota bacterium]